MTQNMGLFDRGLRIVAALVILVFYFTDLISGWTAVGLLALASILIIVSFAGTCPLYLPIRFSSKRVKKTN